MAESSSAAVAAAGGRSTTRLMITRMVLDNFKSYAGQQEIGPFHKRFSSIVGPNGSGKSNVIDALLFVFGKKASKLRLNKVSELIHKSSGFPDLQRCSVEVHFQLIVDDEEHPDDYEVVPDSEFIVSRVVTKDNKSDYQVNAKHATWKVVEDLLKSHGIDLDNNRFLILQGEVEQIAMMKPKAATAGEDGLLEYLEEIIGSNRFKEPIDAVSKDLDALNEQRTEKVNRLKIAERERDNLSGSKGEAEAFMEKERDIRRKKNTLYQVYEHTAVQNVQQLTDRREQAAEKLATEQGKKSESDAELAAIEKTYTSTLAEYTKVSSESDAASEEFSAYERRDIKLQTDLTFQRAQLKKAQEAARKDADKEDKSAKDAETIRVQVESNRRTLDEVQARRGEEEKAVEKIMSGLQEATRGLREQLEAANAALIEAERGVAGMQTEKETVQTALQLAQARADSASKALRRGEEKLAKLAADAAAGRARKVAAEQEKVQAAGQVRELEAVLIDCANEEARLQSALRTAVTNCEEVKASAAQSRNSSNKCIQAIMKASKKGGALASAGVRGRLGDLATIDSEHDVAISTACARLDNVLCDTTEGAEACIRFLKQHNLGRMTFIAADQQGAARDRMDLPFTAPAGSKRLFDLVRPLDPAFRPSLYSALGDCLVTKDLPTATKIGLSDPRNRRRVVTLDGGMVEPMGSISGGGAVKKSGGMAISGAGKSTTAVATDEEFTPQQLAALEAKVKECEEALNQVRAVTAETEKEMRDCVTHIKTLSIEVDKLVLSLARMAEQEGEVRERQASLQAEVRLSPEEEAEVASAQQRLAAIEADIHRASPNLSTLKAEVSKLQRKIVEVGGPSLKAAQDRLDKTSAVMEQISSLLSTKTVEEANSRKAATKAAQSRAKSEAQAVEIEEKLARLVAEQKDMENDALTVVTAVEKAKARMAQQEEALRTITAKFEEVKKVVNKIRAVEVDLREAIEEAGRLLKEEEKVKQHWGKELRAVQKMHLEDQREFNATVRSIMMDKASVLPAAEGAAAVDAAEEAEPELEALPTLSEERLQAVAGTVEEIKYEMHVLEQERERLKEKVNMGALLEYMKKDAFYRTRLAELEVITEQRNNTRRSYEDLRRQRLEEFMGGFGAITLKLKEMYQMITLGGDAELELVDSLDPFSEGIVFSVRPPKKSWKNISNLSGGEKTLSSLALVFALHHYKPTPLYVMDEIDAALDFKNVSIVANYIKERTKNAQFVIISLRNNMFELADRLVGIYKTNDATKSVTINPRMFLPAVAGELVPSAGGKERSGGGKAPAVLGDVTNKA